MRVAKVDLGDKGRGGQGRWGLMHRVGDHWTLVMTGTQEQIDRAVAQQQAQAKENGRKPSTE